MKGTSKNERDVPFDADLPGRAESWAPWTNTQGSPERRRCKEAAKPSRASPAPHNPEVRAGQGRHILVNTPDFQVKF